MRNPFQIGRVVRSKSTLPAIRHRAGSERAYLVAMRQLVRTAFHAVRVTIGDPLITISFDYTGLTRRLSRALGLATQQAVEAVESILLGEADFHTRRWRAATNAIATIDLSLVIQQADIADEFRAIVSRNVGLISGLSEDITRRVEQAVITATINGDTAAMLSETLKEQFGIVGRRADLIARDQIASAVSDLNMIRQKQAGIVSYKWSTSSDERVRSSHVALNGKEFNWDDAGPDHGNHPGQAINCRCVALAVVEPLELAKAA
jgi:SPP1 gp7 family putative phage head morphogenesis protein